MSFMNYKDDATLDKLVDSSNYRDRERAANQGYALDILVGDRYRCVRKAVAKHGRPQDLDILVYDKTWYVRSKVAESGQKKYIDILLENEDNAARIAAICKICKERGK